MDFPLARQHFYQEIHQADEQIDLAKAALHLAQEEYPQLAIATYLHRLDTMATEVGDRLPAERYPLRVIQVINQYLYDELGFSGNTNDYYDPRNSYLNDVLERRTGIPITLSLVYLEIARRIDFPMVGVGMPGHFLIRPAVEEMNILVDPFQGGEVLFPADCEDRLQQIYGRAIPLQPEFLAAISPRHFLARMLTNLKGIYLNQNDASRMLAAIERLLLLFPDAVSEQRDRGILYYQAGRWTEATQDLSNYLLNAPTATDAGFIRQLLERMQQTL
jgi:regulator of sirC expression with transglutaminase-like and TPR domain